MRVRQGPFIPRKGDVRLPGKGNSNAYGARPVHLIITMIKRIRTSRLSIKNSLLSYNTNARPAAFPVRLCWSSCSGGGTGGGVACVAQQQCCWRRSCTETENRGCRPPLFNSKLSAAGGFRRPSEIHFCGLLPLKRPTFWACPLYPPFLFQPPHPPPCPAARDTLQGYLAHTKLPPPLGPP